MFLYMFMRTFMLWQVSLEHLIANFTMKRLYVVMIA